MANVALIQLWTGTQFFDSNGDPLSGGKIFTYAAGSTSTELETYNSYTGLSQNPNPIILDSSGRIPTPFWVVIDYLYNFVLTEPDGTTVLQSCDHIGITAAEAGFTLPDQTGHADEVLATDGISPYWTPQTGTDPSPGTPQTFIVRLNSLYPAPTNFTPCYYWNNTILQTSTDASWDMYGNQLSLDKSGWYKITMVTKATRVNEFDDYLWPDRATVYGTLVPGTDVIEMSQHFRGNAAVAPENSWASLSSAAQTMTWTDVYYIYVSYSSRVTSIGAYVEMYWGVTTPMEVNFDLILAVQRIENLLL